ncbi:MAG: proteasome accessory factor PafA2 family protein [Armatimonadetes bacterium]|nr:proteasome accessory factor PafA2 family protein [Armatimonadota bacterium]
MDRKDRLRIIGIETEFGCLVMDDNLGQPEDIVEAIKDYIFRTRKLGLMDIHARDEVFEPAQSGGFLLNGGRLYIDAVGSHLEYATPECISLKDLVASDRAGQRLIVQALNELGLSDAVSVYNNSIDHFGGHTFGCHENFLVPMDEDFFADTVQMLFPFLVTRQIFAGVGRVGGHVLSSEEFRPDYQQVVENPIDYVWVSHVYGVYPDTSVAYQLSQRADHILKGVASRVRFNRALINPKWEHFYSVGQMQRLHLLFGESNQNEYAYALKAGTTRLALWMIEDRVMPSNLRLENPLSALREISRDPSLKVGVRLADGSCATAIEIQRRILEIAEGYRGCHEETDWVLDQWAEVLDGLQQDPNSMADRIDWVAKYHMVDAYRKEEGLDWGDDALHSVDLEYHNIDPEKSLFHALQQSGETRRVVSDLDVLDAMTDPPQNTRALGRSRLIRKILERKNPRFYVVDWNAVALDRYNIIDLTDPFETYADVSLPGI